MCCNDVLLQFGMEGVGEGKGVGYIDVIHIDIGIAMPRLLRPSSGTIENDPPLPLRPEGLVSDVIIPFLLFSTRTGSASCGERSRECRAGKFMRR